MPSLVFKAITRSLHFLMSRAQSHLTSLGAEVFELTKMRINGHHQNLNHSRFFVPETNLNPSHSPYFFISSLTASNLAVASKTSKKTRVSRPSAAMSS
jgi:hypothetical protein